MGFLVIVGRAPRAKLEPYAESLGGEAFIDFGEGFWTQTQSEGVPHWYTLDKNGGVLAEHRGFIGNRHKMLELLDLDGYAK